MQRRGFFQTSLAVMAAAAMPARRALAADMAIPAQPYRHFDVTAEIDLAASDEPAQLWLPIFQNAGAYQRLESISWAGNGAAKLTRDPVYGAPILYVQWTKGDTPKHMRLVQRVAIAERSCLDAALPVTAAEHAFWTKPYAETNTTGIVRDTARQIVQHIREPKAQARAIYDWIIANSYRDAATPGCGTGDITTMLRTRHFGGKCADINGLMVGLCRAIGIPARHVYGLRLAYSKLFKSLGKSGDVTKAQHCRAEVYLPEAGWFAVDPADVRKAVLEEKLPPDHPKITKLAEHLFGAWENNWAGYNSATGITLAGAPHPPNFEFLMYPCAMTPTATADSLDPAHFAYRIAAAEMAAAQ
jgi:transglutaminase-like putative cysteine protease